MQIQTTFSDEDIYATSNECASSSKRKRDEVVKHCSFCQRTTHYNSACYYICTKLCCIDKEIHMKSLCTDADSPYLLTTSFIRCRDGKSSPDSTQVVKLKRRCDNYVDEIEQLKEENAKLKKDKLNDMRELLKFKIKKEPQHNEEIVKLKASNKELELKYYSLELQYDLNLKMLQEYTQAKLTLDTLKDVLKAIFYS